MLTVLLISAPEGKVLEILPQYLFSRPPRRSHEVGSVSPLVMTSP